MLDVSDIHLLKTISEVGSINKAADKLYMSQPTLSKKIGRLEQVLKVELFHRHSGGMVPTEAALYLIGGAKPIQAQLDAMTRHVERLSNLQAGSLKIGIGPITEQIHFPKVLFDFTQHSSNINITLLTETPDRLLDMVENGSVDLGIGPFSPRALPEGFLAFPLKSAPIIFVARPGHPILETSTPRTFSQLVECNSITPQISPAIAESFNTPIPDDFPTITCNNYTTAKSLAEQSDYITGGPEILFLKELREGTLVKIPTDIHVIWSSYCIIRPEAIHIPAVKKFIEVIRQDSSF